DGIRDFHVTGVQTCALPISAGTPKEIVNKLRDAAVVALQDPKVKQALEQQGAAPSGNTPEEFAAEIKVQQEYAAKVTAQPGFHRSEERRVGKGGRSA